MDAPCEDALTVSRERALGMTRDDTSRHDGDTAGSSLGTTLPVSGMPRSVNITRQGTNAPRIIPR